MLARIREVVSIANGSTSSDPESKRQAIEYFEQLKNDVQSTEIFVSLMTDEGSDDLMRFVALQVVCEQIGNGILSQAQLTFVRNAAIELLDRKSVV